MDLADLASWMSLVVSILAIALSFHFYWSSTKATESHLQLSRELKELLGQMKAELHVVNHFSERLLTMFETQLKNQHQWQQSSGQRVQVPEHQEVKTRNPISPKIPEEQRKLQSAIIRVLSDNERITLKALYQHDRVALLVRDANDVVRAVKFLAERELVVCDGYTPDSIVRMRSVDEVAPGGGG